MINKEIKNEGRNNLIVIVLVLSFFFFAFKCSAQVNRGIDGNYICKTPSYSLKFNFPASYDTLSLTILADSIKDKVYSVMLFSYFTKGFETPDKAIKVWYKDGTYDRFTPFEVNEKMFYVRYNIEGNSFSKMAKNEVHAIEFEELAFCDNIRKKRYFIDFLKEYDK